MQEFYDPLTKSRLTKRTSEYITFDSKKKYPIKNKIPIFASSSYVKAFGDQWNKFRKIELDSYNKCNESKIRFERIYTQSVKELEGKDLLEAGCGAGRFTELFIKNGAKVHSFDLSSAVFANYQTAIESGANESNYKVCMADINYIPFLENTFDVVVCLGVLQHTPNTLKSLKSLNKMVKPGGLLLIDHYSYDISTFTSLYLFWWLLIRKLPTKIQNAICNFLVKVFFPLHWCLRKNYICQFILRRISPIHFRYPALDNSYKTLYELSRLVTHDRNTDCYKHHLTLNQFKKYVNKIGLKIIRAQVGGNGIEICAQKVSKIQDINPN